MPLTRTGVTEGDDGVVGLVRRASLRELVENERVCEREGPCWPQRLYVFDFSFFWAVAEGNPPSEEMGVLAPDAGLDAPFVCSAMEISGTPATTSPVFFLNFSSQVGLSIFERVFESPTLCAKECSLSRIFVSVNGKPCFCWFLAHLESVRSIARAWSFDFLTGFWPQLPSCKYQSVWLTIFDTVLRDRQHGTKTSATMVVPSLHTEHC